MPLINIAKRNIFEMFDYLLMLCMLLLVFLGIAFIYSSGINSEGLLVTNEHIKQIIWASLGFVLMIVAALYDYRRIERHVRVIYFVSLGVLMYTAVFGRYVNGARSWLGIGDFGVQPSEFTKIVFIIMLAKYLNDSQNENPIRRFLMALGIFALPTGLIFIQPDLGTSSIYIPIFLIMCFIAEIPLRYIFYILAMGALTIILTVLPVWNDVFKNGTVVIVSVLTNFRLRFFLTIIFVLIAIIAGVVRSVFHGNKYYYWISYFFSIIAIAFLLSLMAGKVLKEYQIQRLIIFINPDVDRGGAGWNIIQSKTAIGSGGLWGRSFLRGTQSHYRFLPQQSTDFIFSILSEELGFAGGMLVFGLYAVFFLRILMIMRKTSNKFGLYIASGILAMFFFHFFINVGMVMGLMPITGIPLLFLSYGGSSLWTAMICVGILMSVGSRKDYTVIG